MLTTVLGSYRRHRFAWLFFSLLLTLGAHPVFKALVSGFNPLELLLAVNLVAAIASAAHERWIRVLLLLGIAFVVTRGVRTVLGIEALLPISQVLWVSASLLAMAATARHALRARAVDAEHIFAALDAYLLAGSDFRRLLLAARPDLARIVRGGIGKRSHAGAGHLFQLCDDRDAGLRRCRPSERLGTGTDDPRSGGWADVSHGSCRWLVSLYSKQVDE